MYQNRQAFTVAEFFTVLAIIVILSSLIIVSQTSCPPTRKTAAITLELQQLGGAIENFRNEYGAYPPNVVQTTTEQADASPLHDFLRMFKKAFPRNQEPESLIRGLAGEGVAPVALPYGLTASEAIFFWLGGFSHDPRYPLTGPGGPSFSDADGNNDGILDARDENLRIRNYCFEFDLGRIGPKTNKDLFEGRFVEYDDPSNGRRRRINFWQYKLGDSTMAAAYFDTSRYLPAEYYPFKNPLLTYDVAPLVKIGEDTYQLQFVNQGKFQLLHPGVDNVWGNFVGIRKCELLFPNGPFTGALADTLTHFTSGTLGDEQE